MVLLIAAFANLMGDLPPGESHEPQDRFARLLLIFSAISFLLAIFGPRFVGKFLDRGAHDNRTINDKEQ
jgi:hypothetical protein